MTWNAAAQRALDTIRKQQRNGKQFHTVLMDLVSEEEDPITATQSIRAYAPLLPVIAITASRSAEVERRGRIAGRCATWKNQWPTKHSFKASILPPAKPPAIGCSKSSCTSSSTIKPQPKPKQLRNETLRNESAS